MTTTDVEGLLLGAALSRAGAHLVDALGEFDRAVRLAREASRSEPALVEARAALAEAEDALGRIGR